MIRIISTCLGWAVVLLTNLYFPRHGVLVAGNRIADFTTFTDVTKQAGLNYRITIGDDVTEYLIDVKAGGVCFFDYDNDGYVDLYVPNFVKFTYDMLPPASGKNPCTMKGLPIACPPEMYPPEQHQIHHNNENGTFTDVSQSAGTIQDPPGKGLGAVFSDFDNNGWLDLRLTNGHTMEQLEQHFPADTFAEPIYVLKNLGGKKFMDVSDVAGIRKVPDKVGSGTAFADFNNDGNVDILVVDKNSTPTLWRNNGVSGRNWITIRTGGVKSNRPGLGAKIIGTSGDVKQFYEVRGSGSFVSTSDLRVHIGLAEAKETDLEIRWPTGQVDHYAHVAANQFYLAKEGNWLKPDPFLSVRPKPQ